MDEGGTEAREHGRKLGGWRRRRGRTPWGAVVLAAALIPAAPLAAQDPGSAPPGAEAARLYAQEDWAGARAAYRHVVEAEPANGLAWLRLARTQIETGDPAEALISLDEARAADFQSPFVSVFRARALIRLDRTDEALSALESVQDSPMLGGRAALGSIPDLSRLADEPRWGAILTAAEAAAYPCREDPVSRQFDFWVGTWAVFANGRRAGTNRVEHLLEGCALLENWTSVQGRQGKSFNWVDRSTYDPPRWRQLWIADQGNTLDYRDGEFRDGAMRFQGHTLDESGDTVHQKLTFVPVHPDTVRQIFEQSRNGGESWQVTWEGTYVRQEEEGG